MSGPSIRRKAAREVAGALQGHVAVQGKQLGPFGFLNVGGIELNAVDSPAQIRRFLPLMARIVPYLTPAPVLWREGVEEMKKVTSKECVASAHARISLTTSP